MNIEAEYLKMVDWYQVTRKKKNATGVKSVLRYMLDHPETVWFWSWEFVGKVNSQGGFLSHRAPARASDLAIHHPNLVEDRKIGRFSVYRLKRENINEIKEFLQ